MERKIHRYNIGIGIDPIPSNTGVRVSHVVTWKPGIFYHAGIQENDILLEMANQPIKNYFEIEAILFQFRIGDEFPIKFKRGTRILESVVKISTDDPCEDFAKAINYKR